MWDALRKEVRPWVFSVCRRRVVCKASRGDESEKRSASGDAAFF